MRIQQAIDRVAGDGGGTVVLPPGEAVLDRGLRLRDRVELRGQGAATVLRKAPGRSYPLAGYVNYGMRDVPLRSTAGLEAGMTVWITDNRTFGFHETMATITWVEDGRVGLDGGLEADYAAECEPMLRTMHPLVFAWGARGIALRDLRLEGGADGDPCALGSCRGGAVSFLGCRAVEVSGVDERDFHGDGLSFQMCRDVVIRDSRFDGNRGNGLHPGGGSTGVLFERVAAEGNQACGFFFCVRATRVTVRGCSFRGNGLGVSIGSMDCHNLIEDCEISGNRGVGLETRADPAPCEVHHVAIRGCRIADNGGGTLPQVRLADSSHDVELSGCLITAAAGTVAVQAGEGRILPAGRLGPIGQASCLPEHSRHLPPPCHP